MLYKFCTEALWQAADELWEYGNLTASESQISEIKHHFDVLHSAVQDKLRKLDAVFVLGVSFLRINQKVFLSQEMFPKFDFCFQKLKIIINVSLWLCCNNLFKDRNHLQWLQIAAARLLTNKIERQPISPIKLVSHWLSFHFRTYFIILVLTFRVNLKLISLAF